jgi:hypothetical protein
VTLCLPYYLNPGMLAEQFERIRALPADLRDRLCVIAVDDGSPHSEAQGEEIGCPLSIFRIDIDVRWNQDAARNIAARHADTQWLLLTDIDHVVPRGTWERILLKKLDKSAVYRFSRETLHPDGTITPYKPHPNSWLMTRTMYETIGGYDERFAGYYGTDADFRNRVNLTAPVMMLDETLIRVPRETIPDASTTTYLRKQPEDSEGMRRIRAERALLVAWSPERFRFPYHQTWGEKGKC